MNRRARHATKQTHCNVWHPSAQRQCQDDNSIMNPIMSIVEPGRSRSAAPGLIIGLELSSTAGGVWVGLYKTHAGSLGVCLLSLMSLSVGENKRARRRKKVNSPAAAWKCDCLYIDVIYCTYCTTVIADLGTHYQQQSNPAIH